MANPKRRGRRWWEKLAIIASILGSLTTIFDKLYSPEHSTTKEVEIRVRIEAYDSTVLVAPKMKRQRSIQYTRDSTA